jgi:phosphoenolpyruvate carboxykinase (ATP)
MWAELVRERGGVPLDSLGDAAGADLEGVDFVAVVCREDEVLPAIAALEPAQATAFLALGEEKPSPEAANRFLKSLEASRRDVYLLKEGRVGGAEPERSLTVTDAHARAILDAIAAGTVEWEPDPDFGYRVAAAVPGIEGRDRFVLIPRFLYARTERVYDYAALVPSLKRERVARLSALDGIAAEIIDSVR